MLIKRFLVFALCAVVLSACGFHLKGNLPLPESMNVLNLKAPKSNFRDLLEESLSNAGGTIVQSAESAEATIQITDYSTDRKVGTLDDRGKVNSYRIELTVSYDLIDKSGAVYRSATLRERRIYEYDPLRVIESEQEEAELVEAMEQELTLKMLRQLATLADYPNNPKQDKKPSVKNKSSY